MSMQPHFNPPMHNEGETTGRYVVTFRDDSVSEGLASLKKHAGVAKLISAKDFDDSGMDIAKLDEGGGAVFPKLGIAVVTLDEESLSGVMSVRGQDAAILDIEPERIFYALNEGLPIAYLRGYRDAVSHLYDKAIAGDIEVGEDGETLATYVDDDVSTWGLKAVNAVNARYTGRGIKVAVLDTGLDLEHPDFLGRTITSKSFVPDETEQDGNGHGTHCIGTACGDRDSNGRRYGIASEAHILAGKVLNDAGRGSTANILAGIEWAIAHRCEVISMSLGNLVTTPSTAYETVGRRALEAGSLIVAAAGNHGELSRPGNTVGQPANSASMLAVAAVDNRLRRAPFSAISGRAAGSNVDIAGPGVNVYSSVPMPARYDAFNGTSMATPHVAGIAALWAQANRARGAQLWQLLISRARRLSASASQVGAGLVQAP